MCDHLGRPHGMRKPNDYGMTDDILDHDVSLVVTPSGHDSRHNHWKLQWLLGHPMGDHRSVIVRRIEVVQEAGVPHLTNWGAMSRIVTLRSYNEELNSAFFVGSMSAQARRRLERIGDEEPVRQPDGRWNSQSWLMEVGKQAVEARLISPELWAHAVAKACGVGPY